MRIPIFTLFNHQVDEPLDNMLSSFIKDYEIEDIKIQNEYYIDIVFIKDNNKILFHAWNTCKWFAWIGRGYIRSFNDVESKEIYRWDGSRPKRRTMNKLLKKISDHYNKILGI